jgi:hypothetical protein
VRVSTRDGGWCEFHQRAAVLGLPQIPDPAIVALYAGLIAGHDARVLLLGITRALAGLGGELTAIDKSETQIERMWPGDQPDRRAMLGDWREMEPPGQRYSAAIGDGCLSTLEWPGEYCNVLGRVADALEPGGRVVIRCFIAPDQRETLDRIADDVLSGRETDAHATRWRVATAAADANGGIAASELAATWRRIFPPLPELAERTGWSLAAMELLLGSFERATLRYSFVTRAALLDTLPATLVGARFIGSGEYPLAERCPFLLAERAR